MDVRSGPGLFELAGVAGAFVLLLGLATLVVGIVLAVRRGPRRFATPSRFSLCSRCRSD